MSRRLIAGAMSGTSADGVDAALVEIQGSGLDMSARLLAHQHVAYDPSLRGIILETRQRGSADLGVLGRAAREIALCYANAVRRALAQADRSSAELDAVAAHGQTLLHQPPHTIQWIDPALLAFELGCPVISDFRRADCAAGGQGAPLVPFADYILFRHASVDRALINIGGIANLTMLPAAAPIDKLIAFDTGPGNCISDYLMRLRDPNGPGVDVNGQLASMGKTHPGLFEAVTGHPYFARRGPKSTDGPEMFQIYREAIGKLRAPPSLEDQLATACAITVWAVTGALAAFGHAFEGEAIVSGGGTKNQTLMRMLREDFRPGARLRTTEEFGIPSEAKEAMAFALLGAATLDAFPSNVPSCTGASRPVVLGSITPRP